MTGRYKCKESVVQSDRVLIDKMGGPAKVAALLGLPGATPVQRVHNWKSRGIPPSIKVQYPGHFMPELAQAPANTAQAATENVAQGVTNV